MLKVAVATLGCKTNQYESAVISDGLAKEGFSVVQFDQFADIYIINTCTVTARTDSESRRLVRRARRMNPEARIVVTGCYAQIAPEQLSTMKEIGLIVGNEEKKRLPALLKEQKEPDRVMVSDIGLQKNVEPLELESFSEHTRAFMQIQNGCDAFCSYCIVPYARGRSQSVALEAVIEGIAIFTGNGFKEVVLTGIHMGYYGRDLKPQTNLLNLLEAVERQGVTKRLRLGSLDPMDITPELIAFFERSKIICPHLHIPLQSGSDSVLARMNRDYTSAYIKEMAGNLLKAMPDLCIGLDVIAGFPGESDVEFNETYRLIEELEIAYLHVFPFSARPGTVAETMPGHLPSRIITDRAKKLRQLGDAKRDAYYKRFIGREMEALVLNMNSKGAWNALTRNYLPISFTEAAASLANTEVMVKITGSGGKACVAEYLGS